MTVGAKIAGTAAGGVTVLAGWGCSNVVVVAEGGCCCGVAAKVIGVVVAISCCVAVVDGVAVATDATVAGAVVLFCDTDISAEVIVGWFAGGAIVVLVLAFFLGLYL